MRRRIALFMVATILLWGLCACTAAQPDGQSTGTSQGATWQEQYDLGVRYLSEGNYQEAIIAFTAAIEIDPKRVPAYVGRGDAYVKLGETERNLAAALADYEQAVELDETSVEAYLGLADVYIRQGDSEKAKKILQKGYEVTADASIKELLEQLNIPETPPLNSLGGTDFFQRTEYIEFEQLPADVQEATSNVINAVINDDENTLLSLKGVSEEAYSNRDFYTFWNGYKIYWYILPFDGRFYSIEFRPESGTGYYCMANHLDSGTTVIEIGKCACIGWNYNGVAELICRWHYSNDVYEVTIESGTMVNSLREGMFTWTRQYGNDSPFLRSNEYKAGYHTSSTDSNGITRDETDGHIAGIKMDHVYSEMAQSIADELFW